MTYAKKKDRKKFRNTGQTNETKRNTTQRRDDCENARSTVQQTLTHISRTGRQESLYEWVSGHGPAPLGPPAHMYLVILNTAAAATATAASAAKDNAT